MVQPGVTNLSISQAAAPAGFYYAPDPSSQIACTIGGNVAENSGGVHCLKYGLTTNNVLGVEMVLITGEVIRLGGKHLDAGGYDLLGVITGSEGLLGVVTEVTVRLLRKPSSQRALLIGFPSDESAGDCVAKVIAAGIIPAGMEMMDKPAIHAAEDFVKSGYPLDAESLLIVELDGPPGEVDELLARVDAIATACGAESCRRSEDEAERQRFWAGRKAAFPAVGRISPDYYCMDGTIPRRRLPEVLTAMAEMSARYGLRVANVFHAGDGNLHPLVLYDANKPGELAAAEEFGADILQALRQGGRCADRRAWGRRGEARSDARDVQRDRPGAADAPEMCLRRPGPAEPGQGLPPAASLRRDGAPAYQRRKAAASRTAALLMSTVLEPRTAAELAAAVLESAGPLEVLGAGSKRGLGRPVNSGQRLDLSHLSGISLYEPEELVLTAGAGTRLAEIDQALTAKRQMLAFEPPDLGPLYGRPPGQGTLGGMLACNLAGPRRPKAGSARDHFLGALAVNGQGEIFKTGGRVVKNVTGYDLCKLLAGSFGTLAALAEVTVKVLPAPEHERSLLLSGLEDAAAVAIMCRALGSAAEVSGAAHLPAAVASLLPQGSGAATLLRLEGTTLSVAERIALLRRELGGAGVEMEEPEVQDRLARAPRYRPVPGHGRGDLAFVPAAGRRRCRRCRRSRHRAWRGPATSTIGAAG